jgi:3-hydroxy-9,10-secoandrosta-1,3,5(10)-triene-9,17-dione monooxygenase reductase component
VARADDVYVGVMSDALDPFATPTELRDPARRFRGRMVCPVTLWTSGPPASPSGLTISSAMVAEGRPASVLGLVNPTAELWDALQEMQTFVVHLLERRHRRLAERFAGQFPSPGGLFRDLATEPSEWGPKLLDVANRACCRLRSVRAAGYNQLVEGMVEATDVAALPEPLAYYQGHYRGLGPRPGNAPP